MKKWKTPMAAALCMAALVSAASAHAADDRMLRQDDTGVNVRDRSPGEVTADQQGNSEQDREITRLIRKAITDDDVLSTYAQNIKVITLNGNVTLKGPVRSDAERSAIVRKALSVRGAGAVNDQISVVHYRDGDDRNDDNRNGND